MDTPNIKLEDVFKRVRVKVAQASQDRQVPWESSSLTGDFYFIFTGPTTVQMQPATQTPEDYLWNAIGSDNPCEYQAYLDRYPSGKFAPLAYQRLKGCQNERIAKPEPSRPQSPPGIGEKPVPAAATGESPEIAFWRATEKGHSVEDYQAYLQQYPKGKYLTQAKERIKVLQDEAARQAKLHEQQLWDSAARSNIEEHYREYLNQYPSGQYVTLAAARIKKIQDEALLAQAIRAEQENWAAAEKGNSEVSYGNYLQQYPKGRYAEQAGLHLARLKQEARKQEQTRWDAAEKSGDEAGYQAYLKDYPAGLFVALASARLKKFQEVREREQKKMFGGPRIGSGADGDKNFIDHGNGTATDTKTKLTWKRCAEGQTWTGSTCSGETKRYNWTDAMALKSDFAGKNDWRLPQIEELKTIIKWGPHPTIDSVAFPNTPASYFWSASAYAGASARAWGVGFNGGNDYPDAKSYTFSVRLVRGGQ